jgi:ribonuclease Z
MPRVVLLGTGSALSGPERENTYLLIEGNSTRILVDCAGSPAQRLARAGTHLAALDTLILTHTHPDHVYGFPIFALDAWMEGRREPVDVYGLPETLRAARMLLRAVGAQQWPNFFPIRYHRVQADGIGLIFANREFSISATLTEHFVPTIALRVTSEETGASIAYSCDTAPRETVVELARGAKIFFHEATTLETPAPGHSSAVQAGVEARQACAEKLVLLHLPPEVRPAKWRAAARREFSGPIVVAQDLQSFTF